MKKIINNILIISLLIGSFGYLIYYGINMNFYRLVPAVIVFVLLGLLFLLDKKTFSFTENNKLIIIGFLFLAQFLGSVVNLYTKISWYDSFVHYLSGAFSVYIGTIILTKTETSFSNKLIKYLFYFSFACSIIVLWETFEFTSDMLLGTVLQHADTTGVMDTMIDTIMAMLGAITALVIPKNNKKMKEKE